MRNASTFLLIPDPLGYWFDPDVTDGSGISYRVEWRWNVQPEKSACHEMTDHYP